MYILHVYTFNAIVLRCSNFGFKYANCSGNLRFNHKFVASAAEQFALCVLFISINWIKQ